MTVLLILVLVAFLAIAVIGILRTSRVFAGTALQRICGATLFVASVFVALTAVGGGITLAIGMDKFPAGWLIGTPFKSYAIPGLILAAVVGGSAVVATVAALRRADGGALAAMLAGAILLGWLIGERVILPKEAFVPQFWWLEAVYVAAGLLMVLPALAVRRAARTESARSAHPR